MFMFLVECWRYLPFLYFMCTCILTFQSGYRNQCGCYEPLWLPNMTRNIPLVWLDIRVVYQLQVRSTYVHLGSFFSGVRAAHSLVFCIVFCRSLIVCLFFPFCRSLIVCLFSVLSTIVLHVLLFTVPDYP
jgi:hypothetical protein